VVGHPSDDAWLPDNMLNNLSYPLRDTYNWGEKRYLISKVPGSRITFPFKTHAKPGASGQGEGYIKIGHLRSKVLGLGSISCWVDEHEDQRTRVDGWWDVKERNMGMWVWARACVDG